MRRLWPLAVLLAACVENREELSAAQADLEHDLAQLRAVADTLNDRRRLYEALEARVGAAERGEPVEPLPAVRPLPQLPATRTVVLPSEGIFEGSDGARMRARLADTQRRIAELKKVIGEVEKIDARTVELRSKLEALQRSKPAPPQ